MMPLGELAGISSRMQVTYVSGSAGLPWGRAFGESHQRFESASGWLRRSQVI